MCETWQQITPWNVWDLPTATWLSFRGYLEGRQQQQREAAAQNGNHY